MEKKGTKSEIYIALITAGAFISYTVGAGFASGNELLQFFGSWDGPGIVISIICGLLMEIWMCAIVFLLGKQSPAESATENFIWIAGKGWGNFFRFCSDIMIVASFMLMFSGSSNLLKQQFGIPGFAGAVILGILTLLVVLGGLKTVENVLGYIGVIILCYVAVFVLVTLFGGKSDPANVALIQPAVESGKVYRANLFGYWPLTLIPSLNDMNNPVLDGILYTTQTVASGFPFYITLGRRASGKKETLKSGIFSALAFYFCIAAVILMIAFNFDAVVDPSTGEMFAFPALAVVNKLWSAGGWTYSVLIFLGIVSTAIGYLWAMSDRVFPGQEESKKNKIFIVVLTIIGIVLGDKIPFSVLINVMFPLLGVAGFFMLLACTMKLVKLNRAEEKNEIKAEA